MGGDSCCAASRNDARAAHTLDYARDACTACPRRDRVHAVCSSGSEFFSGLFCSVLLVRTGPDIPHALVTRRSGSASGVDFCYVLFLNSDRTRHPPPHSAHTLSSAREVLRFGFFAPKGAPPASAPRPVWDGSQHCSPRAGTNISKNRKLAAAGPRRPRARHTSSAPLVARATWCVDADRARPAAAGDASGRPSGASRLYVR